MNRMIDEPYFTYSAYSALTTGIQVKCPKCHGAGVVTADADNAYFRCLSCGLGPFLGFLPCSPHYKPEVHEDDVLDGNYDFYRPIIRVELE